MARHGRVSVYRRDSNGKYHKCDPRGNYSRDTTFVLRYAAEGDRRVWETLPPGIDHTTARRKAMEREIELYSPPTVFKVTAKPKPLPGFTKIRDAADKYLDALWAERNLTPKTIKGKKFELYRWMGWTTKQHIEELGRDDMIAFRDRLRAEGFADWTVESNKKCNQCADCVGLGGIWKPKTRAGTRTIPISDSLRDLKKRRKAEGLVFPAPEGGVDRHYYRIMETLAKQAGVEKPGVHRFRDTWATDMLRDGVDIFTLRRWVGHEGLCVVKSFMGVQRFGEAAPILRTIESALTKTT